MYRPERSEKVVLSVRHDGEMFYTLGVNSGKAEDGEHYNITLVYPIDETRRVHYEDLFEDTEENRDKIPSHVRVMF